MQRNAEVAVGPHEMTMRRHLADYLDGRLSLAEFTGWVAGAVWEVERYGEPEASTLGYAIELALAERSSGLLTLQELEAELRQLAIPDDRRDDLDVISPPVPELRRDIA